ncbi:TetR/AcrR family transcriptional regulator [Sutcliffiella halmapala]|uniref:TetR/AcrR family transcriptional regulator n=1 Tax=Sutcliffiella halmapala TaxID=79882 RepID=UPI0009955D8C|nr:TetR/AcrR family transcriptional regulator C-terminal domain-containing protein [Sutcliffiella halmapala]
MKESTDRRVIRTKSMIRDALTQLMEEKGFEAITVRDITSRADINRGTFYLHYQDKYDLLEKSEDEIIREIEELGRRAKELDLKELASLHREGKPVPFLQKLLEYLQSNEALVKVVLGSQANPSFQIKLKNVMKKNMLQNMETKLKKEDLKVPVEYLTAYVMAANIGVIQHWLETGMQLSPREISLVLSNLTILGPWQVAGIKQELL